MRRMTIILLTLTFLRISSQTPKQADPFSIETETFVGTSTLLTCHKMKSDCKPGKLVSNERTGIADTTVVYIDGFVSDMTGKKLPYIFFKFIDQKTNKTVALLTTDSTGRMRVSGFNAGTYTLKINAFGYQDFLAKDLKLDAGDKREIIVDMGEFCCTEVETKLVDHGYPPDYKKPDK